MSNKRKPPAVPNTDRRLRTEDGQSIAVKDEQVEMVEEDGLEFEDPFGDDYDENDKLVEEELETKGDDLDEDASKLDGDEDDPQSQNRVWRPDVDPMEEGETLDYDPSAYIMYHALRPEWPCLSFDILRDNLGDGRVRFPLTMYAVVGTQADRADRNKITILKLSDLNKTQMDDSDDEDDEEDHEPVLEHVNINHRGAINRIRSMPQIPGIVATWSETGQVHVWDLRQTYESLIHRGVSRSIPSRAAFSFAGHETEGFAMDWSLAQEGRFATGDNAGHIFAWNMSEAQWEVDPAPYLGHEGSVEDIQWSPTEASVFVSASSDRTTRVWDLRGRQGPMITVQAHDSDVNVLTWNRNVAYLLATGSDDGSFKVWDLRKFSEAEPLAYFTHHHQAITAIEWANHDESMLAVASADNQVTIWDLSVEADDDELAQMAGSADPALTSLPPQLLFVHQGQHDVKDVHFHPQIPGVLMTTASDGFNVFKPAITVASGP